ncbi:MAG: hypothetical protein WA633_18725 [Stellaceae bacterium]
MRLKTDRGGFAEISIDTPAPQLLAVDHRVSPSGTPELAGRDLYNATLFFRVAPK